MVRRIVSDNGLYGDQLQVAMLAEHLPRSHDMTDLKRRTALRALAAVAAATTLPGTAWATATSLTIPSHACRSVVGFGGAGGNVVRRFFIRYSELACQHFVSVANRPQGVTEARDYTHEDLRFEYLSKGMPDGADIPLLVVAGLAGIAGGDLSHDYVAHLREGLVGLKVSGILFLPFEFEGRRRDRALRQAENLVRILDGTVVIDLENLARQSSLDETLQALFDRADQSAVDQIVRFLEG